MYRSCTQITLMYKVFQLVRTISTRYGNLTTFDARPTAKPTPNPITTRKNGKTGWTSNLRTSGTGSLHGGISTDFRAYTIGPNLTTCSSLPLPSEELPPPTITTRRPLILAFSTARSNCFTPNGPIGLPSRLMKMDRYAAVGKRSTSTRSAPSSSPSLVASRGSTANHLAMYPAPRLVMPCLSKFRRRSCPLLYRVAYSLLPNRFIRRRTPLSPS
mmetsp:Transcript_2291/g.4878  ORF Transcript_2291/g.4878 Transcript_2291/m.4878 type:complete len:215 (-) Transcript_2291:517-1161(-)